MCRAVMIRKNIFEEEKRISSSILYLLNDCHKLLIFTSDFWLLSLLLIFLFKTVFDYILMCALLHISSSSV